MVMVLLGKYRSTLFLFPFFSFWIPSKISLSSHVVVIIVVIIIILIVHPIPIGKDWRYD